jgi:DNA-binding transcriptional LysR family regulator
MELPDVLNMSADVILQYAKPTQPELKIARIGRIHAALYASQEYLAIYGVPRSLEELRRHRFVIQLTNQIDEKLYLNFLGASSFSEINACQANTSTSHYSMVVNGLGIGALATFLGANTPNLVALDFKVNHSFDIYLSCRPAIAKIARVRRLIDWLKSLFDTSKYPYFADEPSNVEPAPPGLPGLVKIPIGSPRSICGGSANAGEYTKIRERPS